VLGDARQATAIVLASLAVIAGLLASIQLAVLNGLRRIRPLAVAAAIASIAGAAVSIAILFALGLPGVKVAVPAAALAGLVIVVVVRRTAVREARPARSGADVLAAIRAMIAFGAPVTASLVVSTGVQLVLPVIVLSRLGALDVGYFRAAATISMAYLGFLLSTLSQDYYPRLAAIGDQPAAVATAVREQLRLVMALATPVIFAAVGLAGIMIPLLYSSGFAPAVDLLRWQLSADVLRLPSWCFAFVLLAQGRTRAYFLTELAAGVTLVAFVSIGLGLFGLEGAGIGTIAAYLVYYPLVAAVASQRLPSGSLVPVQPLVYSCLAVAVGITLLSRTGLGSAAPVAGVVAAFVAGALSLRTIRSARRTARSEREAADVD
jgi:PST family polysaccharide transporter